MPIEFNNFTFRTPGVVSRITYSRDRIEEEFWQVTVAGGRVVSYGCDCIFCNRGVEAMDCAASGFSREEVGL